MKCPKCGITITSEKIYWVHVKACNPIIEEPKGSTKKEVIAELEAKGIKHNPRDKKEILIELLKEVK